MRNTLVGVVALGATAGTIEAQTTLPNKEGMEINVTEKTSWAKDVLVSAQSEIKHISTKEDLIAFQTKHLKPYLDKIGMLSSGAEEKAHYSIEDYKAILEQLKALGEIFNGLESNIPNSQRNKNYDYLIRQLTSKSSYKGHNDSEKIYNYFDNKE